MNIVIVHRKFYGQPSSCVIMLRTCAEYLCNYLWAIYTALNTNIRSSIIEFQYIMKNIFFDVIILLSIFSILPDAPISAIISWVEEIPMLYIAFASDHGNSIKSFELSNGDHTFRLGKTQNIIKTQNIVEYIYAFQHRNLIYTEPYSKVYFLSTYQTSTILTQVFQEKKETKPEHFEFTIECEDNITYSILRAAYFAEAGYFLQENSNSSSNGLDKLALFAVFAAIENPQNSVLCVYPIKYIDEQFNAKKNLSAKAVWTFNKPVVSVTASVVEASPYDGANIVTVTTNDGLLIKIGVNATNVAASPFATIQIDGYSTFKTLKYVNDSYLYVADKHLNIITAQDDCSIFSNCTECLQAKVPACGWCPTEENVADARCVKSTECWVPHKWRNYVSY